MKFRQTVSEYVYEPENAPASPGALRVPLEEGLAARFRGIGEGKPGSMGLSALCFVKRLWSPKEAEEWMRDYSVRYLTTEDMDKKIPPLLGACEEEGAYICVCRNGFPERDTLREQIDLFAKGLGSMHGLKWRDLVALQGIGASGDDKETGSEEEGSGEAGSGAGAAAGTRKAQTRTPLEVFYAGKKTNGALGIAKALERANNAFPCVSPETTPAREDLLLFYDAFLEIRARKEEVAYRVQERWPKGPGIFRMMEDPDWEGYYGGHFVGLFWNLSYTSWQNIRRTMDFIRRFDEARRIVFCVATGSNGAGVFTLDAKVQDKRDRDYWYLCVRNTLTDMAVAGGYCIIRITDEDWKDTIYGITCTEHRWQKETKSSLKSLSGDVPEGTTRTWPEEVCRTKGAVLGVPDIKFEK